jgi:two-component system chemotaxis response regulator CheY
MYRIFIIEDDRTIANAVKNHLEKWGFEARCAENFKDIMTEFSEFSPHLVLMDITMPELDGIGALKKIKEADSNALVIMCSAMGQQAMVIESIQAGAKDFIVKPFQADRVLEAVKKVVG